MLTKDQVTRLEPPDATMLSYTLLRHLGLLLDEFSAQGLMLWQNENRRWWWKWDETTHSAERGFWSMGEALVDAVVTRFPAVFDTQERDDRRTM